MKKLLLLTFALFAFNACSDDDDPAPAPVPVDPVSETINVTGLLTGDNTWTSNNTYILNQKW
ncbi:MAG: hypothetical protein CM15mP129_02940 [Chloroflexota bacterium]|nr:MAG: hypothetical protein CM15mP129_02940 [Chloroflexota bacterium]